MFLSLANVPSICYYEVNNIYKELLGMTTTQQELSQIKLLLKKKQVFLLDDAIQLFQCSGRWARQRLKVWHSYTSYNQNGRFYTLPEIPKFDLNGLWHHSRASFSQHGNLPQTVVQLINHAQAGLSGAELGALLRLSPRSFLHHFSELPDLYREKFGGVYVYFSAKQDRLDCQIQARESMGVLKAAALSDSDAVQVLVELIKNPHINSLKLAQSLAKKGSPIAPESIAKFLEAHGLLKKTLELK